MECKMQYDRDYSMKCTVKKVVYMCVMRSVQRYRDGEYMYTSDKNILNGNILFFQVVSSYHNPHCSTNSFTFLYQQTTCLASV